MPARRSASPPTPADTREAGLHRQLSAGQMAMVGVGGSIGTGLLLGSGAAIQIAGPAVIFSFLVAALISWTVTVAFGEMASLHPAAGSFGVYAELYLNSWAGFISRYGLWLALAIAIGSEMVAAATYMSFWLPQVHPLLWVAVFSALLVGINLRSVGGFGEVEYWFAMVKLITIVAFIVIGAIFLLDSRVAPQYTVHGGFFPKGIWAPGAAMSFALFTFAGVEMVAVSSGESRSAADMPRAVLTTFGILTFVYLGAIAILVGVMPWNGAGVTESPFVSVFRIAGLPAASNIMNFVVLTAALSGANASLYVDSRMLFSLARGGYAPARLGRLTDSGAPLLALLASCFGIILALIFERWAPQSAYVSLLGAALFGVMLVWLVTLSAHIGFRRKLSPAQLSALPMRPRGRVWLSVVGIVTVLASLVGTWFYSHLIVVSGVIYVVVLTLFYLAMKKSRPDITMSKP
jgi:AAT family amino acid transporter